LVAQIDLEISEPAIEPMPHFLARGLVSTSSIMNGNSLVMVTRETVIAGQFLLEQVFNKCFAEYEQEFAVLKECC
jgi:hypothetical protein